VVLITFLFWYQTWFGRPLSEGEMAKYLSDTSVPHKTQHALSQLSDSIARGDSSARRWYPQLIAMAQNPEPELRLMAAWAMGQDNHSNEFHQALRRLVDDPEPLVRWNAALALVRFGDASGEPELRRMLQPFPLVAPEAGTLKFRLKTQDSVRRGSVVARIRVSGQDKPTEVPSPVEGEISSLPVQDGAQVAAGETVAVVAPSENELWESLRALYLVGTNQDLGDVERIARDTKSVSERIRQQAESTARAIRERTARGSS
jgi:hypothetical protein